MPRAAIEEWLKIGMVYTVPELGQMKPCDSDVMRPLTWAHSHRLSTH